MINNRDWIGLTILQNVLDRSALLQHNRRTSKREHDGNEGFFKGTCTAITYDTKNRCTKQYNKRNLGEIE